MSFRLRLALGGIAVAAAVLALFVFGLDALIGRGVAADQQRRLSRLADDSIASLATAPRATLGGGVSPTALTLARLQGPFVVVYDRSGRVLFATAGPERTLRSALTAVGGTESVAGKRTTTVAGVPVRLAIRSWHKAELGLSGASCSWESRRVSPTASVPVHACSCSGRV